MENADLHAPEDRDDIISRYLDAMPSGGGWTIRQIVHHIVDGDDIWKLCI